MKYILIMRHGEALQTNNLRNFDFPLSDNGREEAARKGQLISRYGVVPDVILSSPALRAKTTAELVAEGCGYKGEIAFDANLFTAFGHDYIINNIRVLPESVGRVLIVGHNPMMQDLVHDLSSSPEDIRLDPASLVAFALKDCEWLGLGPGICRFQWAV